MMFQGMMDNHHREREKLRHTVYQFAQEYIIPIAQQIDQNDQFPKELWPALGEKRFLGPTVDKQYYGLSAGFLDHVIIMEELSRASASLGLSYAAHSNLCINQLHLYGTEEQKSRYLPGLCKGEKIGALAMSEKNAGSDVLSMNTIAKQHEDHFILNGSKMWITNGPDADVIIVYAKTNPDQGAHGITPFIVEKNFNGFFTENKLNKLGMRGSGTCGLIFNNCVVPKANILGNINQGLEILMNGLDYERMVLAAGPVGIMQACLDVVLPYIHERKQFGKPIGAFELVQAKIADMYTKLQASRAFLYTVATNCDHGKLTSKDAASVLLHNSESATQTALQAIQCLGGNGFLNDYPVGRYLRDAKLYEIGAGTAEIRRIIIARSLFKDNIDHQVGPKS